MHVVKLARCLLEHILFYFCNEYIMVRIYLYLVIESQNMSE